MTTTEETLSDKKVNLPEVISIDGKNSEINFLCSTNVFNIEDVKDFIKKLKEELNFHMPKDVIWETIDKLAGKELIE